MATRRKPGTKKAPRRSRPTRRRAVEAPRLIGGVAVIARGFARSTIDIDATVAASIDEVEDLVEVAAKQGLTPRISDAERFARENLVLLLHHRATGVPVGVSLAQQSFEREAATQAEEISFDGVVIPVPSLTASLNYKLVAGRPQDMRDAEALLKTRGRFDAGAVERTLGKFDRILETSRREEFRAALAGVTFKVTETSLSTLQFCHFQSSRRKQGAAYGGHRGLLQLLGRFFSEK